MGEAMFTPGPQEAAIAPPDVHRRAEWCIVGPLPERQIIASVYGSNEQALADARLYAAATDLYAYAEAAEAFQSGQPPPWGHECEWCGECVGKMYRMRQEALAKARG